MYEDLGEKATFALGNVDGSIDSTIDKTDELNGVSETAGTSFESLSRNIETMKATIAEQLMPVLEPLVEKITEIIQGIAD